MSNNRAAALAASMLAAVALLPAASAAAANAAWSGASATDTWSAPGNWASGTAPSGSVGVLALPPAGSSCSGWGCSFGVDDIPSLTANTLAIDSSTNYLVEPADAGESIELLKGLSFSTTKAPASSRLLTKMVVPLTLGGAQSWNVAGVAGTPTQLALGAVSGEAYPLTVRMSGGVTLQAAELDTGALKLTGGGTVVIAQPPAQPADDVPVSPPPLISSAGVTLAGGASLDLSSDNVVSGPVTVAPGSYSTLQIGHGVAPDGTATVDGNVTLRKNSTLQLWIDQADPTGKPQPSTDASQLAVSGALDLAGAGLSLSQGFTDTQVDCTPLAAGQAYTLVTATQLEGTFAGIANDQVVPLGVCNPLGSGPSYRVLISYNTRAKPQTITATVVGPAQIKALVRDTLTVAPPAMTLDGVLAAGGYTTSFSAPTPGTLELTWTAVSHGHRVTVASASNVARQITPRAVQISLTSAGRQLLYAAAHPPAPKPIRIRFKVKVKVKGKTRYRYRYRYRLKRLPPPPPRAVSITATASFSPRGQSPVTTSRRFTLN